MATPLIGSVVTRETKVTREWPTVMAPLSFWLARSKLWSAPAAWLDGSKSRRRRAMTVTTLITFSLSCSCRGLLSTRECRPVARLPPFTFCVPRFGSGAQTGPASRGTIKRRCSTDLWWGRLSTQVLGAHPRRCLTAKTVRSRPCTPEEGSR